VLNGVTYDFTDHANALGGNRRIPFELGFLASNLISGVGIGPTQWFADDNGFQGFDWRTPAADYLYWDFAPAVGSNPNIAIFGGPNAYSGTWSTTAGPAIPEPGTFGLTLSACAILFGFLLRRDRK